MAGEIIGDILRLTVLAGLGVAGVAAVLLWKKNLASRVTFLRFVVQAVAFAAIFYVFSYTIPLLYALVFIFVMSLFLGRFFCGWLCPFAFLMDLDSLLRKALKVHYRLIPDKLNIALHKSRYVIMIVILVVPIAFFALEPKEIMISPMMAELLAGHYRIYNILIDPMIPFIVPWSNVATVNLASINLAYPYGLDIITFTNEAIGTYLMFAFIAVTLIGAFFIRRVWCRFCPTGVSLAAINQFKGAKAVPFLYIDKNEQKCTKCGVCKRVCPVQVNEVYDQKAGKIGTSQCMLCSRCVEMCPYEDALKLQLGNKTVFHSRNWLKQPNTD